MEGIAETLNNEVLARARKYKQNFGLSNGDKTKSH